LAGVYADSACANKYLRHKYLRPKAQGHKQACCTDYQYSVTKVMAGKVNNASNPDVSIAFDMTTGELRR